jgi:hypothetical protein
MEFLPFRGYRITCDGVSRLDPRSAEEAAAAPELSKGLPVDDGVYRFGDAVFRIDGPGVYRFYQVGGPSRQKLRPPADLDALLRLIGWLWCYGSVDEGAPSPAPLEGVDVRPPYLACSRLAFLAAAVLRRCGYQAREAALMAGRGWNGYDDGHTLVEVRDPQRGWMAYDPSFHRLFELNGRRLSLAAFNQALLNDEDWRLIPLPGAPGGGPFRGSDGEDYAFWLAERQLSETALREWYRGLAGVPMIYDVDRFYARFEDAPTEARPRFEKIAVLLERDAFDRRFPD